MDSHSDFNNILIHYTDENGLYGILQDNSIRASHYAFLNDISELNVFRDVFCSYLSQHSYFEKIDPSIAMDFVYALFDVMRSVLLEKNGMCEDIRHEFPSIPFITSFSLIRNKYILDNGLLSQWRAYGKDGGYAILLNKKSLEELVAQKDSSQLCGECFYDDAGFFDKYPEDLNTLKDYIDKVKLANQNNQGLPTPNNELLSFVRGLVFNKHKAFQEEQEFRVVTMLSDSGLKNSTFDINFGGKPYINIFDNLRSSIKEIIVGPHKEKYARSERLFLFLASKQIHHIKVRVSDIPFI